MGSLAAGGRGGCTALAGSAVTHTRGRDAAGALPGAAQHRLPLSRPGCLAPGSAGGREGAASSPQQLRCLFSGRGGRKSSSGCFLQVAAAQGQTGAGWGRQEQGRGCGYSIPPGAAPWSKRSLLGALQQFPTSAGCSQSSVAVQSPGSGGRQLQRQLTLWNSLAGASDGLPSR